MTEQLILFDADQGDPNRAISGPVSRTQVHHEQHASSIEPLPVVEGGAGSRASDPGDTGGEFTLLNSVPRAGTPEAEKFKEFINATRARLRGGTNQH